MSVKSYSISVTEDTLKDLSQRLSLAKYPTQLQSENLWDFGVPVADLQRLVAHWKEEFDWRKAEVELNKLPNFKAIVEVDGFGAIDLHFVHQVSPVKQAIPLLFSHGWPGSFLEVKRLLPLLRGDISGDTPAFHVVAPSLPNFGFSSGVHKRGFGVKQYAEACHKLMLMLGYDLYVTQGGDWGFSVTRAIGLQYPSHCKASHINLVLARPPRWTKAPLLSLAHTVTPYTQRESEGRKRSTWFDEEGYGYNLLQSTKPQTIGFALADSPVALLAWIYEKLHDWTDEYPWTDDEILTWVSIYWFSAVGPAASVRIYYEATHPSTLLAATTSSLREYIPHVKLGLAHFPQEITVVPRIWSHTLGPVCYQSEHDRGGHFAAWEVPHAIAGDLQKMFGWKGPCYGILNQATGFSDTTSVPASLVVE